jgi:hypothetical protein
MLGNIRFFLHKNKIEKEKKKTSSSACVQNWLQHSDINLELEIFTGFPDVARCRFVAGKLMSLVLALARRSLV